MLPETVLFYGSLEKQPQRIPLRAGPLTMYFDNGDLRNICYGDREVVKRIYIALRDRNWGTIPNLFSNEQFNIGKDNFTISYDVENYQGEIHFLWRTTISGNQQGEIHFSFEGQALSTYWQSRTGFCILHPISTCMGKRCDVEKESGEWYEGVFPVLIAPGETKPFLDMTGMRYEIEPGVAARLHFEGDLFEMEDQRNWTDSSYKTFCTPQRLECPKQVMAGTRIHQSITLSLESNRNIQMPSSENRNRVVLTVGQNPIGHLPQIGLCWTEEGKALSHLEISRLKALNLQHLRVDIKLGETDVREILKRAWQDAQAICASLEVALHLSEDSFDLVQLSDLLRRVKPEVIRWLVFRKGKLISDQEGLEAARCILEPVLPGICIGGGSNADFCELNFYRPPIELMDFVTYSINPQVHAFDNDSLIETLETQKATVQCALNFSAGRPVVVSPVSLKQRFNPVATGPEAELTKEELPASVDPRQVSLFAAAWTLGSIKYLAEGGAQSVTYYESIGWKGVMERAEATPLPEKFHSIPGAVFPLYHVLRAVGDYASSEVLSVESTKPSKVDGLVLSKQGQLQLLFSNMSDETQRVLVRNVPEKCNLFHLNAQNAEYAMKNPELFIQEPGEVMQTLSGELEIDLPPYGILRIECESNC